MVDAGASPRMYAPILDSTGTNRDRVGATRVEGDRPSSLASPRSILRRAAGDLGEARAPYRVVGDLDGDPDGRENVRGLRAGDENLGGLRVGELRAGELRVSALVVLAPGPGLGLASGLLSAGFDRQTSRRTTVPPSSVSPLGGRIPSRTSRRRTPTTARRRSER